MALAHSLFRLSSPPAGLASRLFTPTSAGTTLASAHQLLGATKIPLSAVISQGNAGATGGLTAPGTQPTVPGVQPTGPLSGTLQTVTDVANIASLGTKIPGVIPGVTGATGATAGTVLPSGLELGAVPGFLGESVAAGTPGVGAFAPLLIPLGFALGSLFSNDKQLHVQRNVHKLLKQGLPVANEFPKAFQQGGPVLEAWWWKQLGLPDPANYIGVSQVAGLSKTLLDQRLKAYDKLAKQPESPILGADAWPQTAVNVWNALQELGKVPALDRQAVLAVDYGAAIPIGTPSADFGTFLPAIQEVANMRIQAELESQRGSASA